MDKTIQQSPRKTVADPWCTANRIRKHRCVCKYVLGLLIAIQSPFLWGQQPSDSVTIDSKSDADAVFKTQLPGEGQTSPYAEFTVELSPNNAKPGNIVTLKIDANVAKTWHIYPIESSPDGGTAQAGLATEIKFETVGLTPIDKHFVPTKQPTKITKDGEIERFHEGQISWIRRYRVTPDAAGYSGAGEIVFQACDTKTCVPPKRLAFRLGVSSSPEPAPTVSTAQKNFSSYLIETEPCNASRPSAKFESLFSVLSQREDKLIRKGTINVDGQEIAIYLPQEKTHTTENTANDNTRFGNTSTYISIDQNGDGELAEHEAVPTNLPIRILDSMFEVAEIAEDGSSLSLVKVDCPLQGVVLNRRCPEFSFKTVSGKVISNQAILGTVTILDIWAVT